MFARVIIVSAAALAMQTGGALAAPVNLPASVGSPATTLAQPTSRCDLAPALVQSLQAQLNSVVQMNNGGLFRPSRMWSAVVDRDGRTCSIVSVGDAWPGSRAIALAKAFTANGFSNSALSLSTTMLYIQVQPSTATTTGTVAGGSLYGLNESNPFDPEAYGNAKGRINGGVITFGGGLALYQYGKVIGGLGVSGDTSCADHVIAYRMRRNVGLGTVPNYGNGFITSDNIAYIGDDPKKYAQPFAQPHCLSSDIDPSKI